MKYRAFLFGLDGTLVDNMSYHILAWHQVLNEMALAISLRKVQQECYGKSHEILERLFPGKFSFAQKKEAAWEKEKNYRESYRPYVKPVAGLEDFLKATRSARVPMG